METNSNLKKAVDGILHSAESCTFVELVRKLREKKFDPSVEQVQDALRSLRDDDGLSLAIREGAFSCGDRMFPGNEFYSVVELGERTVDEIGDITDSFIIEADWACHTVAECSTPETAYHACITDWFGDGGARAVYLVNRDEDSATLQWVQLGAATLRKPDMPVREPEKVEPSEEMWIKAETDAVRRALSLALNDNDYRRLRRDASDGVVKLSFSVKVSLDKHICDAVMSGNIKLTNDASLFIENPAQMKLNLD